MERFDWVIAFGLVSCERLMEQFDWPIACEHPPLSLSPFFCAQVSRAKAAAKSPRLSLSLPFSALRSVKGRERERESAAAAPAPA